MKTALVTGCKGQDGALLSELLRSRGYAVTGLDAGLGPDITRAEQTLAVIEQVRPDEIYHLAAVHQSSEEEARENVSLFRQSYEVNFFAFLNLLEAARLKAPKARLFYAASSHVFGNPPTEVQNESTPLAPDSPYAFSKVDGMAACRLYRERHGVFAACGILYTHESPLRSERFLSKKIIAAAHRYAAGKSQPGEKLTVGDLSAVIDWGYAPDYVEAMTRILALPSPDDFVIATGERHTVREFVEEVFRLAGLDWTQYVVENRSILKRASPVRIGNASKLKAATGWKPSLGFGEMIRVLFKGSR
ncbi:MAG: hypothetical protein A2428_16370 [Bdellovibrionales bacterium RIFOXYC1_FULL_54_43]|nr:MAG: hypothetical protein A2428_16370 [Bdellovibrionales bacterium RIFOXYC1_FULL_54_43]OFZ83958.1 MAG: hypothetical protein A2603_10425 [Bdellovibrionales bacterium RIFOXYD1_FULL_55_31]